MDANAINNDEVLLLAERVIATSPSDGFWTDHARSLLILLIKDGMARARIDCEYSLDDVLRVVNDDTELANIISFRTQPWPPLDEELKALAEGYARQPTHAQSSVRLILINALTDFLKAGSHIRLVQLLSRDGATLGNVRMEAFNAIRWSKKRIAFQFCNSMIELVKFTVIQIIDCICRLPGVIAGILLIAYLFVPNETVQLIQKFEALSDQDVRSFRDSLAVLIALTVCGFIVLKIILGHGPNIASRFSLGATLKRKLRLSGVPSYAKYKRVGSDGIYINEYIKIF